ncbi:MAG: GIY-YIG nuclease family protein, partial [Holophagales bacterium]|nr:GIY-YIG nuclease family protein [Holophagales bacterium]
MKNYRKKELQAQYKDREIIGGVYIIKNELNGKILFAGSSDLQGSKNRFEFSKQTGSCVDMKLQKDWSKQGGEQFVFEVLEELKKGETQTAEE